jgi:hypothetical protein
VSHITKAKHPVLSLGCGINPMHHQVPIACVKKENQLTEKTKQEELST